MPESEVTSDFEPQADNIEYRWYSRLGEWYLTACFTYLLIEGVFDRHIESLIAARKYWFFRLTPYNLWPSVLYFYGIGFFVGLIIIFIGRRWWHVPIKGIKAYLALWFVYLGWGLYGALRHTMWWHQDVRGTILPSIVVPWVVIIAQNIRYDVVLSRIIKISIPFAILNVISGILFFARGALTPETSILVAIWKGEALLLLAYVLVFARSIGGGKAAKLPLIILTLGILAPLHKPTIVTFFAANVILVYLAVRSRLKAGSVRMGNVILVLSLLLIVGAGFGNVLFGLGEGAAGRWLGKRVLKRYGATTRELTGGRLDMWKECLDRWKTNPVIGRGLGEKLYGQREGLPWPLPIHNLVVQTLMQTGLIGLAIAAVAAVSWLRRSIKTLAWETETVRVWTRLGLVTYICAILFATLYGESLAIRCIAFTFWIVVGMETAAHSQTMHWSLQDQLEYEPTTIMTDTLLEKEAL